MSLEIINPGASRPPFPPSRTEAELAELDRPQKLLEDPQPHTKLGQQVRRLEQHSLHKAAQAVKACGRVGEKWDFECGRSFVRKIFRAHLRFCCPRCDRHVASRLFLEHLVYRNVLHPAGRLYQLRVESEPCSLSREGIQEFEDKVVNAVRQWLKGSQGWGFKSLTHYEGGRLIAKGIIYMPPGVLLPVSGLALPSGVCRVGKGVPTHAYEALLAEILEPTITEGHGLLRADLMAAFHGGNHLRSLGAFYGLVSKNRRGQRQEKLHLSTQNTDSGAGSDAQLPMDPLVPRCPHCGPSCKRTTVSNEPLTGLEGVPRWPEFNLDYFLDGVWDEMRNLSRRRYLF